MIPLAELIDTDEPGIELVRNWLSEGSLPYEILPPSDERDARLVEVQVTTRSPMGAIVYETGGIIIDHGWIRILGSSCDQMTRSLPQWNKDIFDDDRSAYLVADDVLGGFFAINGGAFGNDLGSIYYLPYDDVDWQSLEISYSTFISWCVQGGLNQFYGTDRFEDWAERAASITLDQCFSFYPFLWSEEGSVQTSNCKPVSAIETLKLKLELINQLGEQNAAEQPASRSVVKILMDTLTLNIFGKARSR